MLSFSEYCDVLYEEKKSPLLGGIKFVNGRDDDFFYDKFKIITFNKDDIKDYKLEGRTAGIMSHACKHLIEVNKEFVDNVISQVKNTIIDYLKEGNYPDKFEFNYFTSKTVHVSSSPMKQVNSAPAEAIINFLDLVNDKYILDKKLAPIEQKMVKYLKSLGEEYGKIIKSYMDKATPIETKAEKSEIIKILNTSDIVSFWISEQTARGSDLQVFLNFKNHAIIMKGYSGVHTMFRINNSGTSKKALLETVIKRYTKRWRFYNTNLIPSFNSYIGAK